MYRLRAENDYLQNQLDEKSREIFTLKSKHAEEIESLKASSGDEAVRKKDEEITALATKSKKLNALVKAKMKELEAKDQEITELKISLEQGASSITATDNSQALRLIAETSLEELGLGSQPLLMIKRIECNDLKCVEMGGAISGMIGGAFGNAFGSAVQNAVGGIVPLLMVTKSFI